MKNKLTKNNKLITIWLHLRRKKMKESSYQRLRKHAAKLDHLLAIATMRLKDIKNLPPEKAQNAKRMATEALIEIYENL